MKDNAITNQMTQSDFLAKKNSMKKTYEIKLNLTAEEISKILDSCLGDKIEHAGDNISEYLNIAECIKSYRLSDEFCRYFANELTPLVKDLISDHSDSYEMTNFQHRMLRKFSNCAADSRSKNIA